MSVLKKLTEGIVRRDLSKDGEALLNKWKRTGLLEGMGNERGQHGMAVLLENQAKELLRETSTMAGGNVEGFASVAFPIVRRVFGGLIANDLVSVQPMSLPSGLIFFLDFTIDEQDPALNHRLGYPDGTSLYGGGAVGAQITGGISLAGALAEESFYSLNNGYSSPTGSSSGLTVAVVASGTVGAANWTGTPTMFNGNTYASLGDALVRFDPDLSGSNAAVGIIPLWQFLIEPGGQLNVKDYVTITFDPIPGGAGGPGTGAGMQVRRLTRDDRDGIAPTTNVNTDLYVVLAATGSETTDILSASLLQVTGASWAMYDNFDAAPNAIGAVVGATTWGLENETAIPEINIQVDSVAVTAMTKKLKAKWTPELAQDLNAYHNLDAEVELTSILSEQIALEIDQEILEDLIKGATADTLYWSRSPGKFLNRQTGTSAMVAGAVFPDFTGNVSEWYETLAETINDVSAQIHRKTLRGGANFVVCSPEVANILEFTAGFRGQVTHDDDRGTIGTVKVGNLSKKWDVYVDPYFPRNVVLVGRKGSSFLESGYVYAPYVPLQMTPTIFGPEDFVPRKGVMTRYAKKMVRPDMYGLVVVTDLLQ